MAIKIGTNVPRTLCFPYGDFKEVNGQFGPQFLYTVEEEGERDKLYATPNLHDQLQAAGMAPGSVLTITKMEGEGNRKSWQVQSDGGNGYPADTSQQELPPPAESPPSNGQERPSVPDFADTQRLVNHCLQTSWSAWNRLEGGEAQFTSEDVCKLSISVFIECCRKGITPPLVEIPAGLENENEADLPF